MLRRLRDAITSLGVPGVVLAIAALAIGVMYCSNDNRDRVPRPGNYHPQIARGDGHMHFLITRSLVFDRDVDFDNDLAQFGDPWNQPRTVTGKKNVMQQIGPSLIWAPLLAIAHVFALVANLFGADIETHGYTLFHQRILFASSVVFAWLAIFLGVIVARRFGAGRWAVAYAGAAVLLGTTLTYYATYMPAYAHAMDAAACAGFLAYWACTLGQLRWKRMVVLGILLGIATEVRIQDLGFGVVLAIELALAAYKARDVKIVLRGAVPLAIALVMFVPQLYVWKVYYDSWLTTPQGPGQMRYGHPMIAELLWSSRNGFLSTHPIAYLGVIGLVVGIWRGPKIAPHVRMVCAALLAAVAIQVYINAVTYEWWSAASFGQRRMASSTLPLVVGLAVLLAACNHRRLRRWVKHAVAAGVLGYLVTWNLVWTNALRHGATAGRDNAPTCCNDVPAPLSWIARPVYAAVGNPFEWPASPYYAVTNGVSLQTWDRTVGSYALVPGVLGYQDGSYRRATASWPWVSGDGRFLRSGFAGAQTDHGRAFRWTTEREATGILPLLMPEPHRVVMPIAANAAADDKVDVEVRCNGATVAHAQIGSAWTELTFDTDGTLGDNQIVIVAEPRPYAGGPPEPADKMPVGVAIGTLRVGLP